MPGTMIKVLHMSSYIILTGLLGHRVKSSYFTDLLIEAW